MTIPTDEELWKNVCMPIYRELFKKATPSCDIDKLIAENKEVQQTDWFMRYYLDDKTQQDIIEKHCRKNKLSKMNRDKVFNEVVLGFSPTGNKSFIHSNRSKAV